ncbi:MAG: PD-(D/E)XK nuclease family protein, partial [Clostridia bacterium]
ISIANNLGITPLIERENSYKNAMSRQIGENLYCRYTTVPLQSDAVELFSASTRKEEVYHLAEKISDYTRLGGRYKDVFVITSDITKYADSIATIFPQFDIPFFCDLKTNLSDHIFSRYIIDYLTLFKNNFRREDTLHFVKNYLFAHSPTPPTNALPSADSYDEDVFVFENYCLKYNINYDFREFSLCAQGDEEMLRRAESVRARFFNLYSAVTFPSSDKVSAYCERIYTLIEQGGVLQNLADLIELQGKNEYSKTSAQVYEKFCAVLTQLSTILGERFVTLDSFIKSLTNTLASVQISVVPIVNDCVVFANMAKARKHDIIYLALLGCNHAVMPIVKQDVKLLSDNNIRQLAEVHIDLQPQISLENKRERFSLYQLLQEPSARLYVSYSTSDNNDTLLPSSIVSELSKMFTSKGKPLSIGQTVGNGIYTRKQALSTIVSQTRRLADMLPVKTPYFNLLTDIFASELSIYTANNYNMDNITCGNQLFFADTYTSVTKIEDYFICPYKSYLSYGLSLKEREVAELKPSVFGNILHAILENYLSAFALPESDITTRNRATASFNYVMSLDYNRVLNESKELAHILRALQAEAISLCFELKHQLENSHFVPYGLEQKFGYDESSAIVINVGDKQLRLKGKIDRIDIHNNNFIILDYKSGRAEYNENML